MRYPSYSLITSQEKVTLTATVGVVMGGIMWVKFIWLSWRTSEPTVCQKYKSKTLASEEDGRGKSKAKTIASMLFHCTDLTIPCAASCPYSNDSWVPAGWRKNQHARRFDGHRFCDLISTTIQCMQSLGCDDFTKSSACCMSYVGVVNDRERMITSPLLSLLYFQSLRYHIHPVVPFHKLTLSISSHHCTTCRTLRCIVQS